MMNHYVNGDIDFENYRYMKKQFDSERDFVRAELTKIETVEQGNRPASIAADEIIADFRENWQRLTNAEKRLFLTNYIKKIVVCNEPIEGSRYGNTRVTTVEFNSY